MQIIIFKNVDGSIGVIHPTAQAIGALLSLEDGEGGKLFGSEADCVAWIAAKDVPRAANKEADHLPYRLALVGDLPKDRVFRQAWEDDGQAIVTSIDKARGITHEKRRAKRAHDFAPHDDTIAKNIPGADHDGAEVARLAIRAADAITQLDIDNCEDEQGLRGIIEQKALDAVLH